MAVATYVTLAPVTYVENGEIRSVTKAGVQIKLDDIQAAALAGAISYIEGGIQNEDLPRTVTLRYWTVADFPKVGDVNYLYLADGTGYLYRWQALNAEYAPILGFGSGGGGGGESGGVNVVNILDNGAIGDGIADDSAAFKAAQAKMRDGMVLHIPAGTYRIASAPTAALDRAALVLSGLSNIGVYFEPGAVLLMDNLIDGRSTTSGILVRGKAEHVTIINPTVRWKTRPTERGGQSNGVVAFGYPSDGAPAEGWLGSTGTVSHLTIVNPTVEQSAEAGIYIVGCSDVNVTGSRSIDTLADGLHFNACRRVTVNNHHALNVEDDGLAFVNYYHPTQKWEDGYIGPFWLPALSEWCSSGTATNVVVNGNRANGFRVQMCQDLAISNVEVTDKDQFFKFTSATLDSGNPWQSLASRNVVVSDLIGADCAGGGCIETYNIDGTDDQKWWDFAGCQITNVTVRNMGNWSFSTEGKDSDLSRISGFTIKNFKSVAGDSTPGQTVGGHGGFRFVGLVNTVIDGIELTSDHASAQVIVAGASQLRTDHLWTNPVTGEVATVHPGVTPEALPQSNLVIDNVVARGCGPVLFQDIAGLTVGRVDTFDAAGVGTVVFKVADARFAHIGAVNPGRTLVMGRGAQVDQVSNVDIAEIIIDTDAHLPTTLWQALEVGGGDATYIAANGLRIEKVVYTSTRNDTVSDIAIQGGAYAPKGFHMQAYWRHSGAASPTWRSQLFGETNPTYLDEYTSHPLYVNTDAANVGVGTGEIAPWDSVVGEVDFNTFTKQGRYYVTGPNPGYLYDGTTSKNQPPGGLGRGFLSVVTKYRSDVGTTLSQEFMPMTSRAPMLRSKDGDAASWTAWRTLGTPGVDNTNIPWIDGPVDFNTLVTPGVYLVAGAFLNGDATTYHQPGNTGLIKLTVTTHTTNVDVVIQEYISVDGNNKGGQRRRWASTWNGWMAY